MDYDTSLLTGAQLVTQTGVQSLANLVASAELALNDFALAAHRAVFRKLKARGIDPTLLTDQSKAELKDAVAYEAVGRLALAGYLGDTDAAAMLAMGEAACGQGWRPDYADTSDSPGTGADAIPAVGHLDDRANDVFFDDTPRLQ